MLINLGKQSGYLKILYNIHNYIGSLKCKLEAQIKQHVNTTFVNLALK